MLKRHCTGGGCRGAGCGERSARSNRHRLSPDSAVQNDLASGAQSFRREDNGLLPLSGLRSTVRCEVFAPLKCRSAKNQKRLCYSTPGCLHSSRISPRSCSTALLLRNPGSVNLWSFGVGLHKVLGIEIPGADVGKFMTWNGCVRYLLSNAGQT